MSMPARRMRPWPMGSLAAALLVLAAQPALAQAVAEPVAGATQLPELSVTARPAQAAADGYQPLTTTLGGGGAVPLMELPQSIAVVPRAVIEDQQARSLDEVLANVSGVAPANSLGGTQDAFMRRGFGDNRDGSIMIDGLRTMLPRSMSVMTDSVEVLKGPASMLYGILDPGGMVNLVPLRPEERFAGMVNLRATSFGGGSAGFDVTGPVAQGFSFRLAGEDQREDYWRNFGHVERRQIAPSLAWRDDRSSIELRYFHEDYAVPFDRGTIFGPRTGRAVPTGRRTRFDEPYNISRGYSDYVGLRGSHQLDADWRVSAGYAYSLNDYSDQNARIISYDPATGALVRRADATEASTRFSHAVRADLEGRVNLFGMRHDLVFGTSYDYQSTRRSEMVRGRNTGGFNIYNPVYGRLAAPGRVGTPSDSDQMERLESVAFYAQDSIHLNEQWILVAGLRYEQFDQVAGRGRPFNRNTDVDDGRLVPRLGLVYRVLPELALYASYSESFKPNSSISTAYGALPPETARSYEIGAKLDIGEGLSATLAAFDIDKRNVAYNFVQNGTTFTATAGAVRSRGVELDIAGRVTRQDSLIGSYAYTDASVTRDPTLQGNRLWNVPRHTASLFWVHDFGAVLGSEGLRAGFGGRFMGERAGDTENSFDLPSYQVFDAFVAYDTRIERQALRLQLNVKNMFDKTYYTATQGSNLGVAIGEPLQVVASVTARF
ncbi:iron complex outermembrane receptor protein [Pseudoroseomonas cervicalis]|nr:iron complex outermembrane receptor protein [Pseudoroseomonas cervicalis]